MTSKMNVVCWIGCRLSFCHSVHARPINAIRIHSVVCCVGLVVANLPYSQPKMETKKNEENMNEYWARNAKTKRRNGEKSTD